MIQNEKEIRLHRYFIRNMLLPRALQRLIWLSPVTWLRQLAAWPMGYEVPGSTWTCLALSAVGMAALALALYRREVDRQEVER